MYADGVIIRTLENKLLKAKLLDVHEIYITLDVAKDMLDFMKSKQAEIAELKEREKKHEHRMTVAELHEKYNSI